MRWRLVLEERFCWYGGRGNIIAWYVITLFSSVGDRSSFDISAAFLRGSYAHTKESRGNSNPCSSKNSQTIASVYRHDQLLLWHVAKALWSSCPINCINFQKRQILLERRATKVFWCYQMYDKNKCWRATLTSMLRLKYTLMLQNYNWAQSYPKRASQSLSIIERWTAPNIITPQMRKNSYP